ncbi:formate/nitrite transporter family protein [Proteiniborus sp.]|uniref:formate/nitrite transporter family protein n=1 Tax=Proteiniborus sp. TaxID=2079015 RepID=UPI0033177386
MSKAFLAPGEIAEATIAIGVKKANHSTINMIILGILAGLYIGFGGHADITIMQTFSQIDVGVSKFLGGAVFPIGLILVIVAGAELFTGNCLMTMALVDKKISIKQMLKNWGLVYLGNFIGSIILAAALVFTGVYKPGSPMAETAFSIATGKMTASVAQIIVKGIFANILVCLAVWMSFGAQDITSKAVAIWFPVMTFVMLGFEHSIANMFFLPLAKYIGFEVSWAQMWLHNIIPATIGNIIGGAIIIPLLYYVVYIKPQRETSIKSNINA